MASRKGVILLTILLLQCIVTNGQRVLDINTRLSGQAYASILTCGPGNEFYESFGHSAIRVCDTANSIDIVFNYGMFEFDQPHFYLKFFHGQLDYFVSAHPFDEFLFEYDYFGRSVFEQKLKLDSAELQNLFVALCRNIMPENRYYKYDFFRDNCATRIRDMIEKSLDGRSLKTDVCPTEENTYRDLIYKHTEETLLWWRFGIDLLLGSRCDRPISAWQKMYIPMEMMLQYDTTHIAGGETLTEPTVQLLTDRRMPASKSISPTLCFWTLFAVVLLLTLIGRIWKWKLYWVDGILFAVVGIVSLILTYMWFVSDHWCTKANLNLIWANPLYLWLLARLRHRNAVVTLIIGCMLIALLAGWSLWPQHFNSAVLPISLTLAIRLADRFTDKNKYIK